jgi:hypothetical protein
LAALLFVAHLFGPPILFFDFLGGADSTAVGKQEFGAVVPAQFAL